MIRIQFNNQASFKDVNFSMLSESAVFLEGKKVESNNSNIIAIKLKPYF